MQIFLYLSLEIQNHGCHTNSFQTPRCKTKKEFALMDVLILSVTPNSDGCSHLKRYPRLSAKQANVTSRQNFYIIPLLVYELLIHFDVNIL
jgi:hypothetical protein